MIPLILAMQAVLVGQYAPHDGDSGRLRLTDGSAVSIRLAGVDAGEVAPFTRCRTHPGTWACSPVARASASAATARARQLASAGARCVDTGQRSWDRLVVRCTVNGRDLGAILVREGWAISAPDFGDPYAAEQRAAQRDRLGVWR